MEKLEKLNEWLAREGVLVFDRPLPFSHEETKAVTITLPDVGVTGIYYDRDRMADTAEEYSALLHESGHYATGATHTISSPFDLVSKHEYKADKWAVLHAVTAEELDRAVADGCTDIPSLAERFGVTEELMRKTVCWYTHGNLATELYF